MSCQFAFSFLALRDIRVVIFDMNFNTSCYSILVIILTVNNLPRNADTDWGPGLEKDRTGAQHTNGPQAQTVQRQVSLGYSAFESIRIRIQAAKPMRIRIRVKLCRQKKLDF
jgi:hypothetical protein